MNLSRRHVGRRSHVAGAIDHSDVLLIYFSAECIVHQLQCWNLGKDGRPFIIGKALQVLQVRLANRRVFREYLRSLLVEHLFNLPIRRL